MQKTSLTISRSVLALGVGCALTALPFCTATAQENTKSSSSTTSGDQKASEKTATELTTKEKHFLNKAQAGNTAEVMQAELALKKSENADVKEFAQKMITDHKQANTDLSEIEEAHKISAASPSPSAEDKALYEQLSKESGTAFDAAYIKHAVTDHEKDVKEYKEAKKEVKDKMLAAYVDKTLTVIEGHLKMAQAMAKKAPAKS